MARVACGCSDHRLGGVAVDICRLPSIRRPRLPLQQTIGPAHRRNYRVVLRELRRNRLQRCHRGYWNRPASICFLRHLLEDWGRDRCLYESELEDHRGRRADIPRSVPRLLGRSPRQSGPLARMARRRKTDGLRLSERHHSIDHNAALRPMVRRWISQLLLLRPIHSRFVDPHDRNHSIGGIQPSGAANFRADCDFRLHDRLQPSRHGDAGPRHDPARQSPDNVRRHRGIVGRCGCKHRRISSGRRRVVRRICEGARLPSVRLLAKHTGFSSEILAATRLRSSRSSHSYTRTYMPI